MSNKPKETNQKHTDGSHIGKLKHQVNNKNHKNNIREIICEFPYAFSGAEHIAFGSKSTKAKQFAFA